MKTTTHATEGSVGFRVGSGQGKAEGLLSPLLAFCSSLHYPSSREASFHILGLHSNT